MTKTFAVKLISDNNERIPIDSQTIREWLEDCHTKGLKIEVSEQTSERQKLRRGIVFSLMLWN